MSEHDVQTMTGPEQWVQAYADSLYRYAISRVGDPNTAEDLVQDTLLAAIQSQRSFRGDAHERTWLTGILRHKVLDHFRAVKRRHEVQIGAGDECDGGMDAWFNERGGWKHRPGQWGVQSDQLMENKEFWRVFHQCLDDLPDRPREVFARKVVEDQDSETVCKELGITPTNLWVVLHRARATLRDCLEKRWFASAPSHHGE